MDANEPAGDQWRQRFIDGEFAVPEPPPYTVFEAWRDYGTPTDWRSAIAGAALPFLDASPALKALQHQWSDVIDRIRDKAPPVDREAVIRGLAPREAWMEADDLSGQLWVLAGEIGAVAGFALAATWSGNLTELPTWLARAIELAHIETYRQGGH